MSFWNQLAFTAGTGALIKAAVGGMGPAKAKHASSNLTIALFISSSVMIEGAQSAPLLGPQEPLTCQLLEGPWRPDQVN